MTILQFNWRLIKHQPYPFLLHSLFHVLFQVSLLGLGWIEKQVFDQLSQQQLAGWNIWTLIAAYAALGLGRLAFAFPDLWYVIRFKRLSAIWLQQNLLAAQLRQPGALPPPLPSGEALSRYGHDVDEVTDFPTWFPHMLAEGITFVIAVLVMASIDLNLTLVIFIPLALTLLISRLIWTRTLHLWREMGRTQDSVSGLLGELLGAVQAIRLAGAESAVLKLLQQRHHQRAQAYVRGKVVEEVVFSFWQLAATVGIGLMLLLASQSMRNGDFSVGDFALFVAYMWIAAGFPSLVGVFIGDYQQQSVALQRLTELLPQQQTHELVTEPTIPSPVANVSPSISPSVLLQVEGLTYRYAGGGGIEDFDMTVPAGSLTVITGKVGSGKTTVLRAILGLLPAQAGRIFWQGQLVADPASWMVPPRVAYTAQVPRLFSDSLRNNLLMGAEVPSEQLQQALDVAQLTPDIAQLANGLETFVGPRGVRLSGGQVQRVAAARMLLHQAQLLVVDDLSSALDVETEQLLWDQLIHQTRQRGSALLVVSHRPLVLQRADQVITLG